MLKLEISQDFPEFPIITNGLSDIWSFQSGLGNVEVLLLITYPNQKIDYY